MNGGWDRETGIVTYFDPAEGDRLRAEWLRANVPRVLADWRGWARTPVAPPYLLVVGQDAETFKPQVPGFVQVRLAPLGQSTPQDVIEQLMASGSWSVPELVTEELVPLFGAYCPAPEVLAAVAVVDDDGDARWLGPPARPWLDGIRVLDLSDYQGWALEDGEAARRAYLDEHVVPAVRATFEAEPSIESAVLLIAQYYDDMAADEVHLKLTYSTLEHASLEHDDAWLSWNEADPINFPAGYPAGVVMEQPPSYDELAIDLFAACCVEGGTQDDDNRGVFTPFAHFTRVGDDVATEVVGTVLRPWLEGLHRQR